MSPTPQQTSITTEPLAFDASGAPFSLRYGDVYASRVGALEEKRHVFLRGNGLPQRWAAREQFVVLEAGFGLGLNFLLTWQAWREDPQRPRRLHFVSIECHPLSAHTLVAQAPAPLQRLAQWLAQRWPLPLPGVHRLCFEEGAVTLTLVFGNAHDVAAQLDCGADAFYLDGFSPARNPQMWTPAVLKALTRCARPEATLATYTCARTVCDSLTECGFALQRVAGFGTKREMLIGRFAPRWKTRRYQPPMPYQAGAERQAIVIGAGLAGCATSAALAARGWQVSLLDAARDLAQQTSRLPAGLLHPAIAADDNLLSRLTRAGVLQMLRWLDDISLESHALEKGLRRCGVFHQATDTQQENYWRAQAAHQRWPAAWLRWAEAGEAQALIGVPVKHAGWWFESGAVLSAPAVCQRLLQQAGSCVQTYFKAPVQSLQRTAQGWQVQINRADRDGGRLTLTAPVVVLANAQGMAPLLRGLGLLVPSALQAVRGRLSLLPAAVLPHLRAAVTGDGYVAPNDHYVAVGASYELASAPALSASEAHQQNLQRLQNLVDGVAAEDVPHQLFDAWRYTTPDRLPLLGCLSTRNLATTGSQALTGLYLNTAYGSRGLTWAWLLGEQLAASIEGEPALIERDLSAAIRAVRLLGEESAYKT